jgi:hypothetical protein
MILESDGKASLVLEAPNLTSAGTWTAFPNSKGPILRIMYQAGAAYNLVPSQGETAFNPNAVITWERGVGADMEEVYFDGLLAATIIKDADPNETVYDPSPAGTLVYNSEHTYQIISYAGGVAIGETVVHSFTVGENEAPVVDIEADTATVTLSEDPVLKIDGIVTDDGLPVGSTISLLWDDGGAGVAIAVPTDANTIADFTGMNAGVYTLTLSASDTEKSGNDSIIVTVYKYAMDTITIGATDDTYLGTNSNDNNYGDTAEMTVQRSYETGTPKPSSATRFGVIKFDIHGEVPGAVEEATLNLNAADDNTEDTHVRTLIYGVAGEWFEGNGNDDGTSGGLTWGEWINFDGGIGDVISATPGPYVKDTRYDFDVTAMQLESDGKVSFVLDSPTTTVNGKGWSTKESDTPETDTSPELTLLYQVNAASSLSPVQGETRVNPNPKITWTRGVGADSEEVLIDGALATTISSPSATEYQAGPFVLGDVHTCQIISSAGGVAIGETAVHTFTVTLIHPDVPINAGPADGAENVVRPVLFDFIGGEDALATGTHTIQIGVAEGIYDEFIAGALPGDSDNNLPLALDKKYFWNVKADGNNGEQYSAETSFETEACEVIDDFEGAVWAGGVAETAIVHAQAGEQSMAIDYADPSAPGSATLTFAEPKDLLAINADFLRIRFHGGSGNDAEFMTVTLDDGAGGVVAVAYDGDPDDIIQESYALWKMWYIDLNDFAGVTLTSVQSITIGVGDGAGTEAGTIYVDDITVCASMCLTAKILGDFTGKGCMGDPNELIAISKDWLLQQEDKIAGGDITSDLLVHFDFESIIDPNDVVEGDEYYVNLALAESVGMIDGTIDPNAVGPVGFGNAAGCAAGVIELDADTLDVINAAVTTETGMTCAFWAYIDLTVDPNTGLLDDVDPVFVQAGGAELSWKIRKDGRYLAEGMGGDKLSYEYGADDINKIVGVWNHCAYTTDFFSASLYVNGELVQVSNHMNSEEADEVVPLTLLRIGNRNTNTAVLRPIKIDDFKLYNRILTQEEVMSLAGVASVTQPVISAADVNGDGIVNLIDFAEVASIWMLQDIEWP